MSRKLKIISKRNLLLIAIIFFSITFNMKLKVNANTDIDWNNRLIDGKDIAYYIIPGNEYTVSIPQAVKKLINPSGMWNPIKLSATSVQKHSKMDIYEYSEADGRNANTSVFIKNSNGVYENSTARKDSIDWLFGDIHINDNYMSGYDNDLRSTIILHEMLHVYGCKDIINENSIMYKSTPLVRSLTSDANDVLIAKYDY